MKLSDKQVEALRAVEKGMPWLGIRGGSATGFAVAARNRTLRSLENAELIEARFCVGSRRSRADSYALTDKGVVQVFGTAGRVIKSRAQELREHPPLRV